MIRRYPVVLLIFVLIVISFQANQAFSDMSNIPKGSINLEVGDYLKYNWTISWGFPTPRNNSESTLIEFTVVEQLSPEVFNVSTFFSNGSPNRGPDPYYTWFLVNVTDNGILDEHRMSDATGFNVEYFLLIIPTNVSVGTMVPIRYIDRPGYFLYGEVVDEQNITLYDENYSCWHVNWHAYENGVTGYRNYWFEQESGVLLLIEDVFEDIGDPMEQHSSEITWRIVEAKTGDFFIVPEFPSTIVLPLFIVTTLLAVIIYRRKHST